MSMNKLITVAAVVASAMAANASSIVIDRVQQCWPWNNKVKMLPLESMRRLFSLLR
jgi:hypothetical protein